MAACKYALSGTCKFGNQCRNEHPQDASKNSSGITCRVTLNKPAEFNAATITKDFDPSLDKPAWSLSSYGPSTFAPTFVSGLDISPEELRLRAAMAISSGTLNDYLQFESTQIAEAEKQYAAVRTNPAKANQEAQVLVFRPLESYARTSSSNVKSSFGAAAVNTTCGVPSTPSLTTTTSAFGQPAQSTGFGQTSAFGSTTTQGSPAFGSGGFGSSSLRQPATGASAFSQPALRISTFGQPTTGTLTFGQLVAATSAFGQPAAGTSDFRQPAGGASAFAQAPTPSAFALPVTTSVFGQPAASSALGQALQPGAPTSSFEEPAQTSAFGQSCTPSTFGQSPLGQPAQGTSAFEQASTTGASAFGQASQQSAFEPTSAFGSMASAFGQTVTLSALGQISPGQAPAPGQTAPTSTFGQSTFGPSSFGQTSKHTSAFGQPSQPAATSAFGSTSTPSAFDSTPAFGTAHPISAFDQTQLVGEDSTPFVQDEEYYCPDIVILVENVLFRVPLPILAQSQTFCDRFLRSHLKQATTAGMDAAHPLRLNGVNASDFRRLLRVLFPLRHGVRTTLTVEECMSILTLSTLWNFESVRVTTIDALASYADEDPVLKIFAALKYDIPGWLVPGVNALAQRDQALTSLDVDRFKLIGDADVVMDLVLKIARVRESFVPCLVQSFGSHNVDSSISSRCSHSQSSAACPEVCDRHHHDFTACICAAFHCDAEGRSKAEAEEKRQDISRYLREEAEAATELQRQAEAKAEEAWLAFAKADRQAEEEEAKSEADVLRKEEEEAREAARAAEDVAEVKRQRLYLEESKRVSEAGETECKLLEDEEKRKAKEFEDLERQRLIEEQRMVDEEVAAATEAARLRDEQEEAEHRCVAAEEEQRRLEEYRPKLSAAEASIEHSKPFWSAISLSTRPPVPRSLPRPARAISAEDQAKLDAITAELQSAEAEVEWATAAAKKLKDVADAEETTATKLEAESVGNAMKKARAGTARRKAVASAKAAAPGLKAMEEAAAARDAIQARLDALRLSLVPPSLPATTDIGL